jgi:hypothetical protein
MEAPIVGGSAGKTSADWSQGGPGSLGREASADWSDSTRDDLEQGMRGPRRWPLREGPGGLHLSRKATGGFIIYRDSRINVAPLEPEQPGGDVRWPASPVVLTAVQDRECLGHQPVDSGTIKAQIMRMPRFRLRTVVIVIAILALCLTIIRQTILLRQAAVREELLRAEAAQLRDQALWRRDVAEAQHERARAKFNQLLEQASKNGSAID